MADNADLLSNLNPEQFTAVTAPNRGSLLVLAGAGCGKTAVLTRRIVYLARSGICTKRICALTFSRKAAEEMAHRLEKLDPSCGGANAPLVTTFHAFALRVLQERFEGARNFSRIGFDGNAKLLDARQRYELLAQATNTSIRKTLRMGLTEIDGALNLLSSFREKAVKKWDDEDVKLLTQIENDFAGLRRARGLWDFSDLIEGCLKLFQEHPRAAKAYSDRYDAVLVDEFQDTNPTQIDLLDIMLASGATLYAVGDDDQAIYGFRGADIRPIMNFTTRFRDARIVKLQINYRSIPAILNCANRLWADKPAEYRKTLITGLSTLPTGCKKPQTMRFGTQAQALEWILGKARFIQKRENIPIGTMAVLFRINDTLTSAANHYKEMGVPPEDLPQFLTVHASKGLEYPAVFLCDLEEGVFPHYKIPKESRIDTWAGLLKAIVSPKPKVKIDAACDVDEELRLFYVGVTRAQRFLYFVPVSQKPFYGRAMNFAPSRFLKLVK
ncbi:MAG: ATP-dependent helicase [Chitinispirillia bacterium]|nr:ATP-dependent helicase [Chitinispirillia bacterium]MCL2241198.1 ATP-dependent helicase [Chitinispirillia bacterium]